MEHSNLTSWFSVEELENIGFKRNGHDVKISRKASIYSPSQIELGSHVRIDDFVVLSGGGGLKIGNYVHVACYCGLFANAGITLEDYSGLSSRVVLYTYSDDYSGLGMTNPTVPQECKEAAKIGPIILGRHVIVGTNSTILPGVVAGEGAAVCAHSLVTRDLEPFTVYFGVPARKVGKRKMDLLKYESQIPLI